MANNDSKNGPAGEDKQSFTSTPPAPKETAHDRAGEPSEERKPGRPFSLGDDPDYLDQSQGPNHPLDDQGRKRK